MKTKFSLKYAALAVFLFSTTLLSFAEETAPPKGWFPAGNAIAKFTMNVDHAMMRSGKPSAMVSSTEAADEDAGTLMQVITAQKFLGKRLRISGYVKTKDVKNWAGIWMRVNSDKPEEPLGFDNMMNRPLKGTLDWKECAVVLDIPPTAKAISYGLLLNGQGQVWLNGCKVEVVGKEVPITGGEEKKPEMPSEPENLDFK